MPNYDKSAIQRGMFMTSDGGRAWVKGIDDQPPIDKSRVKAGAFMIGGPNPGTLVAHGAAAGPVIYGEPFAEAARRLEATRQKLDELVAATKTRRR